MKLYEAMFLMDVQSNPDMGAMESEIRRILDRAQAEVVVCRRWEDRRLAYEIAGRKRGSYWLTYFNAPPENVAGIERDVQLSEKVLRVLVLRAEQVPAEELAPPQQAGQAPAQTEPPAAPAEGTAAQAGDEPAEVPASQAAEGAPQQG